MAVHRQRPFCWKVPEGKAGNSATPSLGIGRHLVQSSFTLPPSLGLALLSLVAPHALDRKALIEGGQDPRKLLRQELEEQRAEERGIWQE